MAVYIYVDGRWHGLAGNRIYDDVSTGSESQMWHQITGVDQLWFDGGWHRIGELSEVRFSPSMTYSDDACGNISLDNVIWVSPDGAGNGSSPVNPLPFRLLSEQTLNAGTSVCFLEGNYVVTVPILIKAGVNYYGGFSANGNHSPFQYVTAFSMSSDIDTLAFAEALTRLGAPSHIDGFSISGYSDVMLDDSINTLLTNCKINFVSSGRLDCSSCQNIEVSNSNLLVSGNASHIYATNCNGRSLEFGGEVSHSELNLGDASMKCHSLGDSIVSSKGRVEVVGTVTSSTVIDSSDFRCSASSDSVYLRSSVDIDSSARDIFIGGDENRDLTVRDASQCQFVGKKPSQKNQKYSGMETLNTLAYNNVSFSDGWYVQAHASDDVPYGAGAGVPLVRDYKLYVADCTASPMSIKPVDESSKWTCVTGYARYSFDINASSGTATKTKELAYGIRNGILFAIDNEQLESDALPDGGAPYYFLRAYSTAMAGWTTVCGKSSNRTTYTKDNTQEFTVVESQSIEFAYGLRDGSLYAILGIDPNERERSSSSSEGGQQSFEWEEGLYRIGSSNQWTKICGYSRLTATRSNWENANNSIYAYGICNGYLYALNGIESVRIGQDSNGHDVNGWTEICGYSDSSSDSAECAFGICNNRLYSIKGTVASLIESDAYATWKGISGYWKNDVCFGCGFRNGELRLLRRFSHLAVDADATISVSSGTSIYYVDSDHVLGRVSVNRAERDGQVQTTVSTATLPVEYHGSRISILPNGWVVLDENNFNSVFSADRCKYYNCSGLFTAAVSNSLMANCGNVVSGIGLNNGGYRIGDYYHRNPSGSGWVIYGASRQTATNTIGDTVVNVSFYNSNGRKLPISSMYGELDSQSYSYAICEGRLYYYRMCEITNAGSIVPSGWIVCNNGLMLPRNIAFIEAEGWIELNGLILPDNWTFGTDGQFTFFSKEGELWFIENGESPNTHHPYGGTVTIHSLPDEWSLPNGWTKVSSRLVIPPGFRQMPDGALLPIEGTSVSDAWADAVEAYNTRSAPSTGSLLSDGEFTLLTGGSGRNSGEKAYAIGRMNEDSPNTLYRISGTSIQKVEGISWKSVYGAGNNNDNSKAFGISTDGNAYYIHNGVSTKLQNSIRLNEIDCLEYDKWSNLAYIINDGCLYFANQDGLHRMFSSCNSWTEIGFGGVNVYGIHAGRMYRIYSDELNEEERMDDVLINGDSTPKEGWNHLLFMQGRSKTYALRNNRLYEISETTATDITNLPIVEKYTDLFRCGDGYAVKKQSISDMVGQATFCTFASCEGSVKSGKNCIYWNCDGEIGGTLNAQSRHVQGNEIPYLSLDGGVDDYNGKTQFYDTGYSGSRGLVEGELDISISHRDMAQDGNENREKYERYAVGFGDFHFSGSSNLRTEDYKGKFDASNEYDLDGNNRDEEHPCVGAYEYNSSYRHYGPTLDLSNLAIVSNDTVNANENSGISVDEQEE